MITAIGGLLVGVAGMVTATVAIFRNKQDKNIAQSADWQGFSAEVRENLAIAWEHNHKQSDKLKAIQEAMDEKDASIKARDAYVEALRHQIINRIPPPPIEPPIPY